MRLKKWRFIDTGLGSAEYNMAVDEMLLNEYKDTQLPIFRLYTWEHSLSFGRFSDAKSIINIKSAQKKSLGLVRRMTGGGVLVHGGDISYSLIFPIKELQGVGIKESYRHICGFLIRFYEKLGLKADFASVLNLENKKSSICMNSNEAYDLVINKKKIGGNAQRYTKNFLFQHGSIPLNFKHQIFEDVFLEESGLSQMLTLDKIKKDISTESIKKLLVEAFTESFKTEIIKDSLNSRQIQKVDELLKNKYSTYRWNTDAKLY